MSHKVNREGQRFRQLVVTKRADPKKYGSSMWHCRCDCGGHAVVDISNLLRGSIKGCGCRRWLKGKQSPCYKHGGGRGKNKREYRSYLGMRERCYNSKSVSYSSYGEKGITVCARWLNKEHGFENFLADMGPRPKGKSLDRENPLGNYEAGNCRWADKYVQAQNRACCYTDEELAELKKQADQMAELCPGDLF
jgi:hypothetical protein